MEAVESCSKCNSEIVMICQEDCCLNRLLCLQHSKQHQHLSFIFFNKAQSLIKKQLDSYKPMSKQIIEQLTIFRQKFIAKIQQKFDQLTEEVEKTVIFNSQFTPSLKKFQQGNLTQIDKLLPVLKNFIKKTDQETMQAISGCVQNIKKTQDKLNKQVDRIFNQIKISLTSTNKQFVYQDNSSKGIIDFIATDGGISPFKNLMRQGIASVFSQSGFYNLTGSSTNNKSNLQLIFDQGGHKDTVASVYSKNQAYFIFEFKHHQIILRHFQIYNHYGNDSTYCPDNIELSVFVQNVQHRLPLKCTNRGDCKVWSVQNPENLSSSKIKIDNGEGYQLLISRIQFYGTLINK